MLEKIENTYPRVEWILAWDTYHITWSRPMLYPPYSRKLGCNLNPAGLAQRHLILLEGGKISSLLSKNIYSLQKGSRERGVWGGCLRLSIINFSTFTMSPYVLKIACIYMHTYTMYVAIYIKKTCKDKETHWIIISRKLADFLCSLLSLYYYFLNKK